MSPWEIVGWTGNACYFARFLWQWLASERAGRVVAPTGFWWLSLVGVACFGAYSIERGEPVLFAGASINALIYLRNVVMAGGRARWHLGPWSASILALAATALLFASGLADERKGLAHSPAWLGLSVVGQAFWSSRFVLQWWWAERARRSGFPPAFWWCSLAGNVLLLAYALHLADPVYVAGFVLGPIVQMRNLMLSRRGEPAAEAAGGG